MRVYFLRLTISIALGSFVHPLWAQQSPPPTPAAHTATKQLEQNSPPSAGSRLLLPPKETVPMPVEAVKAPVVPPANVNPQSRLKAAPLATANRGSLQKFADNLAILLLSLGAYNDPTSDQKNRIVIALNKLKVLAPEVQPQILSHATDPVMRFLSWDMPKQFLRIEAAVNAGTYNYARYLLRQTTQFSVGLHSTNGPKNPNILQFPEPPNNMSELEKAEYYAAIKRYEEAMLAYERVLGDKQFKIRRPELWLKAVENLMAITIRIRKNAHITLEMSSALLEEGGYTNSQKEMLQAWRNSAKVWTAEEINQKFSGADLLTKAQQIIEKGNQLTVKGENFGSIEYMRAIALLSDLAQSNEPDALKSRSFLLAGKTSEKLRNVFLWMYSDAYYEACIRAHPHSAESRECIKLLETFQAQQKDVILDRDKLKTLVELAK